MPAKGWRKDEQESNFDTVLHNENVGIDTFLFPRSTINKLSKQVLHSDDSGNGNYLLAKDSQTVIQRSTIVFINFIYHHAKQIVKQQNRKVVNADDILSALNQVGFGDFLPTLQDELQKFTDKKEAKKLAKAAQKINDANVEIDADDNDNAASRTTEDESNSKRIKLDQFIHKESNNDQSFTVDDLENEEDEDMPDAAEQNQQEDAEDDEADEEEDDEEEEEINNIHKPSQLELEQKELAGEEVVEESTKPLNPSPEDVNDDEENDDNED